MLILVETSAGYALFKLENEKLVESNVEDIQKNFVNANEAKKQVSLQSFKKFKELKKALKETNSLIESKLGKGLKKFLKKSIVKPELNDSLMLCDKSLGQAIKKKLNINIAFSNSTQEIIRGIRTHLYDLLVGIKEEDAKLLKLSLSHSLNRFKLKFSPDKVDVMIVQAIGLLEDLDKEINIFSMRLREWYGWHFPELGQVITDNCMYAKCIKRIGFRKNTKYTDLSEEIPEGMEKEVKQLAEVSIGTDIGDDDLLCINEVADRLIELHDYRESLSAYIKYRMTIIAPNLTYLVGDLIGAKLIAKAGTLMSLAKHPSSTVQVLGSEKALFRALKTKSKTPKYGLIYHATLVGQAVPKLKGKISRSLAAKLSLCSRVDALASGNEPTIGIDSKVDLEKRMHFLTNHYQKQMQKNVKTDGSHSTPKYNPANTNGMSNGKSFNNNNFGKNRDFNFKRKGGPAGGWGDQISKKFIKKQKRK